jgi:tetratricopeptide (TPR) repeat protein
MTMGALMASLDGLLEDAVKINQNILNRGEELNLPGSSLIVAQVSGIMPLLRLGRADELLRMLPQMPASIGKVICQAYPNPNPEVIAILDAMIAARPEIGSNEDKTWTSYDAVFLEAAVLVGHKKAAELLIRRFADSDFLKIGRSPWTCIARHLGGAAALLGKYDEARKYYDEALKVATEMKFRPEITLTRLNIAELLLEHYPDEKKEALEHLDFAIKEFREMKMQPSLERALRHKDILKA